MLRFLSSRSLSTLSASHSLATTPRIQSAAMAVASFDELKEATKTRDAQVASTLLHRLLQIVKGLPNPSDPSNSRPSMGKNFEAVVHGCLSRHYHAIGDVPNERLHRIETISALVDDNTSDDTASHALVAMAYNSLALACLRVPSAEAQLAAQAAAAQAEQLAVSPNLRMASSLFSALARQKGSKHQHVMLSALTAMPTDLDIESGELDIPGYARFFLALLEPVGQSKQQDANAIDQIKALLIRWDNKNDFDMVEALCAAAQQLRIRDSHNRDSLKQAEDFLTRALRTADSLGNALDKSESLLGLAQLYALRGQIIEAEGLFRNVEERFEAVWEKKAFTVSSADMFCRTLRAFAAFLEGSEINGKRRDKEGALKRERLSQVQQLYPLMLGTGQTSHIPLWFIDSALPHFEIPAPELFCES